MTFYLIGIDHKTVRLSVREGAHKVRRRIERFLREDMEGKASILFTCNRVEVYGIGEDFLEAKENISLICEAFPEVFKDAYTEYGTHKVLVHALRLAIGLESQLLGEKEIMKQLKSWTGKGELNQHLKVMWGKVLKGAEVIRRATGLEGESNIARIVMEDISGKLSSNGKTAIAIIGTGKVAELFAKENNGLYDLYFIARKKHSKARRLAKLSGGSAEVKEDLLDAIGSVDVLISATSSPHYVLKKRELLSALKKRNKAFYIYDLAVPRDIEPDVWDTNGLYLDDIDTLSPKFRKEGDKFLHEAALADILIVKAADEIKGDINYYADSINRYAAKSAGLKTA
ncbi:MAG: hypothetical protein HQ594_06680 [Candidatus Omnitrophica bacterium]|nr:hypothetical protein [Candidatus Omnitrophota bacterium]